MWPGFISRRRRPVWVLSLLLLILSFAPRGFSSGTPVFPFPQKTTFPNSSSTTSQADAESPSGWATSKSLIIIINQKKKNKTRQQKGEGKTGENLSEQGREPTTNLTHIWRRSQDSNLRHISGGRAWDTPFEKNGMKGNKIQVALPRSISYGNFYWSMNYPTNV